MSNLNLEGFRNKIDMVDDKISELLNERVSCVKNIREIKQTSDGTIYRPEREGTITNRLKNASLGFLDQNAIEAIYQETFVVSRNLEVPQIATYLGPEGTYTHQAARNRSGTISHYIALATIEDTFKELSSREAKYGVIPIENNTKGTVSITLDCLGKCNELKIFGEIYMDIHHSFVGVNENLEKIRRIYSHPQGYSRCRRFLENHELNNIEFVSSKSAANAAYLASQGKYLATIYSKIAAKLYNVSVLFDRIGDNTTNHTGFLVLSDIENPKVPNYKASILAHTAHKPGGLSSLLEQFKEENINLTRLESRPVRSKEFLHSFYIDFKGHIDGENVQRALKNVDEVVWLGSYLSREENEIQWLFKSFKQL